MRKTTRKTRQTLPFTRILGVCVVPILLFVGCSKNTPEMPAPTETLPSAAIPTLTPQSQSPDPESEAPGDAPGAPPMAAPTVDFGDVLRTEVLTTAVQSGDTVYAIAFRYDLQPESIVWANPDILAAPWLIRPGQALTVLPVDGVYHLVQPGETVTEIASAYGVDPGMLYNPWNDLQSGVEPQAGQWLVVPGGEGPEVVWEPAAP